MLSRIRELKLPRRGRAALGLVLTCAILLPGFLFVGSSDDAPPEPDEADAAVRELASNESLLATNPLPPSATPLEPERLPDPGELADDGLAALAPEPFEDGVLPEPMEVPTEWYAPAATELHGIETSTSTDGRRSLIQLRADGTISNAEVSVLADPDRLVIDLPGMASAMASSRVAVDSNRVARVRVGAHADRVRVVLDAGSDAEGFVSRLVEAAPDGLRITLGPPEELAESEALQLPFESPHELEGALAGVAPETQPVASIAPPDASPPGSPEPFPTAGEESQLPLYLLGGEQGERSAASAPELEDRYDCIIEPFEVVEVGSALTAVVESVEVERSDFVETGQLLAQLEASPERATVAVANARARMDGDLLARRARMELGWRKRKRADQLYESEALSADLRDEILTEAEVTKAVVKDARERKALMELEYQEALERLNEHTIRSPVSGVVIDRMKSPGEVVKEETIVVLAQIDPLRVEVILPAAAFGSVEPGMRAEVIPELPNAGVQVASVAIVDRVVDGTSGTFGVRLELPNADFAVPSGLRCQVRFLKVD